MITARRLSQCFFLIFFLWAFLCTTYPLSSPFPVNFFFLLSPLAFLTASLSAHRLITALFPALLLLLSTFIAGRYFCGWMCPLGATLDLFHRLFPLKQRPQAAHRLALKYYLLAFVTVASVLSFSPAYLLEPLSFLFRTLTCAIFPAFFLLWRQASQPMPFLLAHPPSPADTVVYQGGFLFLALFFILLALEGVERRFWCRNLCPMGALLGMCSRLSLCQKKVSQDCTDCGLCKRRCRTAAIAPGNKDFLPSECVYCMECMALCPSKAISFSLSRPLPWLSALSAWVKGTSSSSAPPGVPAISRRSLLLSCGGGLLWSLGGHTDYGSLMKSSRLIRPPGSLDESLFLARCIRCGECMKVCVTNGLQPSFLEAGFSGLWTPRLVPLRGYCEENCNLCSQVCPTGAIRPIEVSEKKNIPLGKASIDSGKCIAWKHGAKCMVCDEHCSYKAVDWIEVRGIPRPIVKHDRCVGCGICENKCPTAPDPAIVVYGLKNRVKDNKPVE